MLVTSTGLRTAPDAVNEPITQPSSAAPSVEGAPAEILISTQQMLFDTAVVQRPRRAPLGGRIVAALRHMVTEANRPRHPYLRHYAYIEDARMAREMDRL